MVVHYDNSSRVRQIAKDLLDKKVKYLDPDVDGIKLLNLPLRRVLKPDMMPEYLFQVVAPITDPPSDLRDEIFGYGSQHIESDFRELRHAIQIAEFGLCDREVLRRGEETLQRLIQGMKQFEVQARESVAPENALLQALNWRAMKRLPRAIQKAFRQGRISRNPEATDPELKRLWERLQGETMRDQNQVTPNEIDEMQAEGLYAFQQARHHRITLEEMLDTLQEINRELDKDSPGPGPSDLPR
jgi:hypothetical protein